MAFVFVMTSHCIESKHQNKRPIHQVAGRAVTSHVGYLRVGKVVNLLMGSIGLKPAFLPQSPVSPRPPLLALPRPLVTLLMFLFFEQASHVRGTTTSK